MAVISNLVTHLTARTEIFDRAIDRSGKKLTAFQNTVAVVDRKLLLFSRAATTLGLAMAGISAKEFISFEKQMARISTVLNEAGMKQMPAFTLGIKKMAVEFGVSTKILTKGLHDILKAGIVPTQAMKLLELHTKAMKSGLKEFAVDLENIRRPLRTGATKGEIADNLDKIQKPLRNLQFMMNSADKIQKAYNKTSQTTAHGLERQAQMFKIAAANIGSFFKPAISGIAERFLGVSNSLIDLRNDFARAFPDMTFFLKNFGTVMEFAMTKSALEIVRFANITEHYITKVIPGYFKWLQDQNFGKSSKSVGQNLLRGVANTLQNMEQAFFAIKDLKTPKFVELTQGFEKVFKQMPKIAEREIGLVEKALEISTKDLLTDLAGKYIEHMDEWEKRFGKNLLKDTESFFDAIDFVEKRKGVDAAGEALEINKRFISVAGLAIGGTGSVEAKILEETKKQTPFLRIIAKKEGLG